MKRFKTPRPVPKDFADKLKVIDPVRGESLSKNLEKRAYGYPFGGS